ncbi:MAG: diguanylate cyclase [Terriglobia bacterium]
MSQESLAAIIALCLLGLYFMYQRRELREERAWDETALLRYSSLHLFTTTLDEITNPEELVEKMLDRTLQALDSAAGCFLLQTPPPEELQHSSARGISPQGLMRLSEGRVRRYLVGGSQGWGRQMVFADLRGADSMAGLQHDETFQDFRRLLMREGLRTVVVESLRSKERTYGTLLIGSHKLRTYQPGELRLLSAIGHQISVTLENRYLHQAAQRHHEDLSKLHHVGEALSSTVDPEAQIQILRTELKGFLGSANFTLAFRDSEDGSIETVMALDRDDVESDLAGSGLLEYVFQSRTPVLINYNVPGKARLLGVSSIDPRIRTWGGIPLRFSDGSMGVLAIIDFEREYAVDEEQFKFLQVLASGINTAIEKARLFQREQRRSRHLAVLNELGRKSTAVLDPRELLLNICHQARGAFGYNQVWVEILDRRRGELVVEAQAGCGVEVLGRRTGLGSGFAGIAAERGEPVLSNRVRLDARYITCEPRVQSAMSIPLKHGTEVLGVLSFGSFFPNSFSDQDVVTLGMLADQVAIAFHNARAYQTAQEQAITDGLTGLKTHRYFREALEAEWRRAPRSGQPFSVIMMDLDDFKRVNDQHGHVEGDKVLLAVAQLLTVRSRQSSVAARYGGDEFAILMANTTVEQAEHLAERVRSSMESDPYLSKHRVTASIGIATFPYHGATPEEVMRIADSGMYMAKHADGNRVCLASASEFSAHVEAYLGVAVQRMISTGPDAFEHYFNRIKEATENSPEEGISLLDTVTALAFVIDAKDHYTQGHSQSVARLASAIARQLGMSESEVEEIRLAGILHDIGKIGIPETLLNKPAILTAEEYEIMKGHVLLGWKILSPLKVKAIERICRMVRHHHERVDGQGYPDGLKGEEIPLGARILKIADAFDTIVSERSYQPARSIQYAVGELRRGRGSHFDPILVDAFLESPEVTIPATVHAAGSETVN